MIIWRPVTSHQRVRMLHIWATSWFQQLLELSHQIPRFSVAAVSLRSSFFPLLWLSRKSNLIKHDDNFLNSGPTLSYSEYKIKQGLLFIDSISIRVYKQRVSSCFLLLNPPETLTHPHTGSLYLCFSINSKCFVPCDNDEFIMYHKPTVPMQGCTF